MDLDVGALSKHLDLDVGALSKHLDLDVRMKPSDLPQNKAQCLLAKNTKEHAGWFILLQEYKLPLCGSLLWFSFQIPYAKKVTIREAIQTYKEKRSTMTGP